jgi:hypothetical protein
MPPLGGFVMVRALPKSLAALPMCVRIFRFAADSGNGNYFRFDTNAGPTRLLIAS